MLHDSLPAAILLAAIHLFSGKLHLEDAGARRGFLSFAGGISVSYALVHLLPELIDYAAALAPATRRLGLRGEHSVYSLTLAGLIVFYGLERSAQRSEEARQAGGAPRDALFHLHLATYAVYNALLGYVLVREDRDPRSLLLYTVGIGVHLVVNDRGLVRRHQQPYRRYGRWILSAAILLGWGVGSAVSVHPAFTASVTALLAGGILLNTFKEELPEERESRFWAFAAGAAIYAGILIAI